MTDHDNLTARIAAIVRAHQFRVNINGDPEQVFYCECQEGRAGEDHYMLQMIAMKHPAHVAEVIVEQLGLIQQWAAAVDDPDAPVPYTHSGDQRSDAEEDATNLDGGYVVTRYVTKWEAES